MIRPIGMCALFFAAQAAALAQLDPDTLTVTITRSAALQPDQVRVSVSVGAPVEATLDDVVAAVQSSGAAVSNLSFISSQGPPSPETFWQFDIPVPFAHLKETLAAVVGLQESSSFNVSFYVGGLEASPGLQASQPCPYTSMVSYARTQAQKVAAAAGVNVGPIVGISDSAATGAAPTAVLMSYFIVPNAGFVPFWPPSSSSSCIMTVQFKLLH